MYQATPLGIRPVYRDDFYGKLGTYFHYDFF